MIAPFACSNFSSLLRFKMAGWEFSRRGIVLLSHAIHPGHIVSTIRMPCLRMLGTLMNKQAARWQFVYYDIPLSPSPIHRIPPRLQFLPPLPLHWDGRGRLHPDILAVERKSKIIGLPHFQLLIFRPFLEHYVGLQGDALKMVREQVTTFNTSRQCPIILLSCF